MSTIESNVGRKGFELSAGEFRLALAVALLVILGLLTMRYCVHPTGRYSVEGGVVFDSATGDFYYTESVPLGSSLQGRRMVLKLNGDRIPANKN